MAPNSRLTQALESGEPPREDEDPSQSAPEANEPDDENTNGLSFDLDELESDDEPEAPVKEEPEARQSRLDKKRERGRNINRELQEEREARIRLEAELKVRTELEQRRNAPDPQAEAKKTEEEFNAKRQAIRERLKAHARLSATEMDAEAHKKWEEDLYRLRDEETEINNEYYYAKKQGNRQNVDPEALAKAVAYETRKKLLQEDFEDVLGDDKSREAADGIWHRMVKEAGLNPQTDGDSPKMWKIRRAALEEARKRARPTESTKDKYIGSSAASARGSGRSWSPNTEDMKIANAAYSHIKDKRKRVAAYYRDVIAKK